MIVVDASVVVDALGDDGQRGALARQAIGGTRLVAPSIFDLETLSAWRRQVIAGSMSWERAQHAVVDLRRLRVQCPPHTALLPRIWELRKNLTTCDATYVAMAEQFDVPLVTADQKLADAPGTRCEFSVVG